MGTRVGLEVPLGFGIMYNILKKERKMSAGYVIAKLKVTNPEITKSI